MTKKVWLLGSETPNCGAYSIPCAKANKERHAAPIAGRVPTSWQRALHVGEVQRRLCTNYVTCTIISILAHATQFNPLSQQPDQRSAWRAQSHTHLNLLAPRHLTVISDSEEHQRVIHLVEPPREPLCECAISNSKWNAVVFLTKPNRREGRAPGRKRRSKHLLTVL